MIHYLDMGRTNKCHLKINNKTVVGQEARAFSKIIHGFHRMSGYLQQHFRCTGWTCTFPEVTVKFETIHFCSRHSISRYNSVINYYRTLCVGESLPRNLSLWNAISGAFGKLLVFLKVYDRFNLYLTFTTTPWISR